MQRSILIGLVAGQRSMTPLAALAGAARRGALPHHHGQARLMARPLIAGGAVALAAAEMAGDKMTSAPDRTVFLGLLARTMTGGFAGATLAAPGQRLAGAMLAIGAALASSYVGLAARKGAMRRWGQTSTGLVEDAMAVSAAHAIATVEPARARRR